MPLILDMLREPLAAARGYDLAKLRGDVQAGLSVSVVTVPQAMAYALIAGVPVEYGLYTAIVQGVLGALLSSQPFLSVGPTNTQALLVGAVCARAASLLPESGADPGLVYLQLAIVLTLFKGLLQTGMALLRFAALLRYVSASVLLGFSAGAGVLIAVGQVPAFLGMEGGRVQGEWPGFIGALQRTLAGLEQIQWEAVAIGCLGLAIMLAVRRWLRFLPGPLLAVAVSGALVAALGQADATLPTIAPFSATLPQPLLPPVSAAHFELLGGGALALAALGLMEAYAIGRRLAVKSGVPIRADHEFLGQGLTSVLSSFFGCFPGSGSFARSALNYQAGARTRYAGVWNALFVLAIVFACAPLARYVPLASLAAILFIAGYDLVDWREMRSLRAIGREDLQVCLATFAATLLIPLAYAVFVGIALNLALYLRHASRLKVAQMVEGAEGTFEEIPLLDRAGQRPVALLQLEGDLFFGVADELEERLGRLLQGPVQVVILRLKRTHGVDATVLGVLERFAEAMRARGRHVLLAGLRPETARSVRASRLAAILGPENLFETAPGIFASVRRALERARALVSTDLESPALSELDLSDDPPAYEI